MANGKARVRVPKILKRGEVFEVKSLITHKMESGQRRGKNGKKIPRQIINKFVCSYNGKDAFSSDWYGSVSENPYLSFHIKALESGFLNLTWTDDTGAVFKKSAQIVVT